MRLIIQRVKKAIVTDRDKRMLVGEIGNGLFVLIGIKKGDSKKEADYLAEKLIKLRVMSDRNEKMNLSIRDVKEEILVVSQFTLYGETKGQNRPSFINAENPEKAEQLYDYFIEKLRELNIKVKTGSFGNYMEITPILDGPVTIIVDSK